MFRGVPLIGFLRAKSLKDTLWGQKYLKLKMKVGGTLANDLDLKFENIL